MSAVDRVATQLNEQGRRIEALERARSLARSSLVDASIPVLATGDDGSVREVGRLGKPVFDALEGLDSTLAESRERLDSELGEHAQRLEDARKQIEVVEDGLAGAQANVQTALAEAAEAKEGVQQAIDAALDATTTAEAAQEAIDQAVQDAKKASEEAQKAQSLSLIHI